MLKNIGVFRALDVRFTQAEFAASFTNLKPFFAANLSPEIEKYVRSAGISYKNIPLQPRLFFDPVYPLLQKTDFTPWLEFDSKVLSTSSKGLDIYEIYEPYFFYSSQIANLAKKNNVPLVTEIWTSFPQHPSKYVPPYNFIVKNVIQKTDLFVLRSKRALSFLDPFTIPESKKTVIYHGVNLKRFYPAKQKGNDRIRILFVGALHAHKGLDDLLAIFPSLVEKYPNKLELVVCGAGSMKEQIKKSALTLPIIFKGFVSYPELPDIYRSADIYCQPSKDYVLFGIKGGEEFAGYTFMEAMASGLPVVSSFCGGIPEIVGSKNSLISQGNRNDLYIALEKLISNKTLRKEIGLQNRMRAEKVFDLFKQTKLLENIIQDKLS